MTLAFLSPSSSSAEVLAESPFASATIAAGAVLEGRAGWRVPVGFGDPKREAAVCGSAVGWADVSHLGKFELQVAEGDAGVLTALAGGLAFGTAVRHRHAWWCLLTPVRALVLAEPGVTMALSEELAAGPRLSVVDVSTQLAALRLGGPEARETFARFCALDLRPHRAPVGAFRAGSVARVPGFVVREEEDQYLTLVGAAYAEYFWTVVADAGTRLGGRPVGVDVLPVPTADEEAGTHA
jgi:heterotetrameric sarcosine oxidase gamma subunit